MNQTQCLALKHSRLPCLIYGLFETCQTSAMKPSMFLCCHFPLLLFLGFLVPPPHPPPAVGQSLQINPYFFISVGGVKTHSQDRFVSTWRKHFLFPFSLPLPPCNYWCQKHIRLSPDGLPSSPYANLVCGRGGGGEREKKTHC